MGFFEKLKEGLAKTKSAFVSQVDNLFKSFVKVDEELFDELEELLICADVGVGATEEILDKLRDRVKSERLTDGEQVKAALREIMADMIGEGEPLKLGTKPSVLLIIGVNGVGKTTSIGKIAAQLKADGKKVVVAAADTFRAAAIDQLAVWCDRAGVDLIKQSEGSDPAAVVYDAVSAAKGRNADVLIVDTAGRLHNKKNLMDELAKIDRVLSRELPGADRETLQVMAYEPTVLFVAVCMFLALGTFDVAGVANIGLPMIAVCIPTFLALMFVLTIKLRKSPFDLSYSHHAHQELVKGVTTEMSGRTLAKVEVMHWCETTLFLGWVAMFFIWDNPVSIVLAVAVAALAFFLEIFIDNNFARVKWQKCLKWAWIVALVCGLANTAWLVFALIA